MDAAITIKGTRDGLLITLESGELPELLSEIRSLLEGRNTFFRGGKVAVEVRDRKLSMAEAGQLRRLLETNGVQVWAILGTDPDTRAVVQKLGMEAALPTRPAPQAEEATMEESFIAGTGVLIHRTLRSGQSVYHAGHVVILGDVNSGSEVIAGGDVIVWGRLRGTVHAGVGGDEGRCVCALDLSPTQLRIGNYIARPPEDRRRRRAAQPERAFVSGGQLVAEKWK
ncbi:MAG TPA: septum site-determining protein MinC [Anaerolineae bacterium]|nr:septum site-determining protein MinC [Anaerolineae bacterium]